MKILKIVVMIHTGATDKVYIHTDMPSPFLPDVYNQPLTMQFEAQATKGIEYVKNNFKKIPIGIINLQTGDCYMEELQEAP